MGSPHSALELWGATLAGKGPAHGLHMLVLREQEHLFQLCWLSAWGRPGSFAELNPNPATSPWSSLVCVRRRLGGCVL